MWCRILWLRTAAANASCTNGFSSRSRGSNSLKHSLHLHSNDVFEFGCRYDSTKMCWQLWLLRFSLPHKRSCLITSYTHSIMRLGCNGAIVGCWSLLVDILDIFCGLRACSTYGFYIRRHLPARQQVVGSSWCVPTSPGIFSSCSGCSNKLRCFHLRDQHVFGTAILRPEAQFSSF